MESNIEKYRIIGCIPFSSYKEKKKIIYQLRLEYRPNLRIWEDNNMITYESVVVHN